MKNMLRLIGLNPFGRSTHYRVSQTGLFGTQRIRFGNNKPKSKHKTRRTWLPNAHTKELYSEILDRMFKLKVTTRILRTIDKKGGLDKYLLGTKDKNIASERGLEIKSELKEELKKRGIPWRSVIPSTGVAGRSADTSNGPMATTVDAS